MLDREINLFMSTLRENKRLDEWQIFFTKERTLYEALNKMEVK